MPPRRYSRHSFAIAVPDACGRIYLTERVPFRFRPLADTKQYTVKQGDSLFTIAARSYEGLPRPAGLWWVLADFQPEPIVDPTIALPAGLVLYVPSLRVVQEQVFNDARRSEDDT
jgi:hypothetical protein